MEIYQQDVTELSRAIAAGELTPAEVTEAFLARIAAVEGRVRAFTTLDEGGARRQAAMLTGETRPGSPLHGIPFGVKEVYHVAGMPTDGDVTRGKGEPQPDDSWVARRLKEAGAVLVGKLWAGGGGDTRNPWNLEHTPGGSSTGSGAAAGARELPFTIGEQTAGSHLRPAMFNGVVGFKPSFGRIGRTGLVLNAWTLDHVGIMAPSVADVGLVYEALQGPDPDDPSTALTLLREPQDGASQGERAQAAVPPRVGVIREYFYETSQPAMQAATDAALERLAKAGAEVVEVALPEEFRLSWYAHGIIFVTERATMKAPWLKGGPVRRRVPSGRTLFMPDEAARLIPSEYYLQALRLRRYLRERVEETMRGRVDVLLTPAAAGPAPKASEGGGDPSFQSCWSLLGLPAIQVPNGLSPDGLPLGVQLIGRMYEDGYLLGVAGWVEGVLGRLPVVPLV